MEEDITQENLLSSDGKEPVNGPFAQYYDVDMELNLPQELNQLQSGNNLYSHVIPLMRSEPSWPRKIAFCAFSMSNAATHKTEHLSIMFYASTVVELGRCA